MTFCSECGAKDRNIPVMTFHNGKTYGDPLRITTTDSMQVILAYCNDRGDYYKKQTKRCLYEDKVVPGFHREVYIDRICDGIPDCPEVRLNFQCSSKKFKKNGKHVRVQ